MRRRAVASATALVLTLASTFALAALVVPSLWLGRTLAVAGTAFVVLLIARARTSGAVLPSVLALVAGLLATCALYFPDDALAWVLPTRATIASVIETVPATFEQMRSSYPPLTSGDGVAFFVTVGVLVVFTLSEMLAVGTWAPAWAGLPVLGLWCVPILLGSTPGLLPLGLAAACYGLLIALQARDDAHRPRRRDPRATRATAIVSVAAIVVALVVAPALLRVPVPIRWHPFYELVGSSTTRLDLGLGLRDDLLRSTDTPLFEYAGASADEVGPLHAYTVSEFTGNEWLRGSEGDAAANAGQVLWPTTLDGVGLGSPLGVTVNIYSLGQDRLLLPGEPRTLSLNVDATYLATVDEVVTHVGSEVQYQLEITPRLLDPATLEGLRPATDVDPELLEVPDTGYQSDIADLARQIVADAGAETPYAQLLAIQNYLRDPARFVYSTSIAAPQSPDAVWDFLNDRHGYCVQFATTMIVMARSLGMPARMAVGFLPGQTGSDGLTQVTADRAHAWPQVLFEGVGWVRFEPTPGVQAGPPPEYAPEPEATSEAPTTEPPTATEAPSTATAAPTAATTAPGSSSNADSGTGTWVAVLAALVALAAAAVVLASRRARLRPTDLGERWQLVLLYLDRLGVDTSPSQTPRAVVRGAAQLLDGEALDALSRLADEVEIRRYGPAGRGVAGDAELESWVAAVIDGARTVLAERRQPVGV